MKGPEGRAAHGPGGVRRRVRVSAAGRRLGEGRAPLVPGELGERAGGRLPRRSGDGGGRGWTPGQARAVWGGEAGNVAGARCSRAVGGGGSALASGSLYCVSDLGMAWRGVSSWPSAVGVTP